MIYMTTISLEEHFYSISHTLNIIFALADQWSFIEISSMWKGLLHILHD